MKKRLLAELGENLVVGTVVMVKKFAYQCRRYRDDPLEKEMATHFSIVDWRIPWTEEPGRLQSMGLPMDTHGHPWGHN